MKVLILTLGEKKYTTGKITAYLTRKSFAINKMALQIAKMSETLGDEPNTDEVFKMLEEIEQLKLEKANLICEVYGNKFSVDDLEKELSDEEIDEEISRISYGISGEIEKN